jgi:hypothetical protein
LRAPFVLELPDLGGLRITAAEARIPRYDLHTIHLRVLKPYSDLINYGDVYTRINGESAGTIQDTKGARDGHIAICNLDSKPRFQLRPGKNVIEVSAVTRDKQTNYYASYVLLADVKAGGAVAGNATIESIPISAGDDREPPTISLTAPGGAVRSASNSKVRIHGVVADNSGEVVSVTVNGQAAQLAPATGTRALIMRPGDSAVKGALTFERTTTISPNMTSLTVEARDRAGNVTRLAIPVGRRETAEPSRFDGRKFAVIVGVSRYKYHDGGLSDLNYADADARAIRDFLQRPEGGDFSPSNVLYLENERATIDGLRGALTSFLPKAGPNDLLFIFIAGHGAPDPYAPQNLYFLMHDTKVADMPNSAMPMRELQELLEGVVRAQRAVVMVDTCHSAGLTGKRLTTTRGLENNLSNLYAARLYDEKGRAVLTSSDVNELSHESPAWGGGHGVFTQAILEGFGGEADVNHDRLITAGELFDYVRNRVRLETGFRQNPTAQPGLNAGLPLAFIPKK